MLPILGLLGMALGAVAWLPLRGRDDQDGGDEDDPGVIEVDHDDSGMYGAGELLDAVENGIEDDMAARLDATKEDGADEDGADEDGGLIEVTHDDSGMYGPEDAPDAVDGGGGAAGACVDAADEDRADETGTDGDGASEDEHRPIEVVHDDSGLYGPDEVLGASLDPEELTEDADADGTEVSTVHSGGSDQEPDLDGIPDVGLFALALAGDAEGAANVEGFDAAEEALVVLYDGAAAPPDLACAVDDEGATLLADGEPIAYLPGARAIDLDAVRLVAT